MSKKSQIVLFNDHLVESGRCSKVFGKQIKTIFLMGRTPLCGIKSVNTN